MCSTPEQVALMVVSALFVASIILIVKRISSLEKSIAVLTRSTILHGEAIDEILEDGA